VDFGGFLEPQQRLSAVMPMGMATGKQPGFGNPDAFFILPQLNFGNRDNHCDGTELPLREEA
jgi:hypothetical protein